MPQDGLKSVVYRSFVTCNDPKGVVDCNIVKISRISSQKMGQKIKTHRTSRNSSLSLASKAEKEELISKEMIMRERLHDHSSLQLMEVCREAKKLNQMVESWSKGLGSDRKSEELAEDLLEGTLDLKESLIMLSKFQEASKQSAHLKQERCRRSSSHQLRGQSFPVEFQRSQLSGCGSSTNGADEIKKVIKDSLVRRNVTPNATVGEKSYSPDMNSDSGSDIPSTSSSKSSMVNDNVNCRLVSTYPQKNLKHTNLIAKLMGLEEISSRPMPTIVKKESDCEKMSGHRRPLFDIDVSNARKSKSLINKEVPEKETLREILENVRIRGLIESDDRELKLNYHPSHSTCSKERLKDVPPIVLIKPIPYNGLEESRAHVSLEEEALNINAVLQKMNMKGLRPFDNSDSDRGILSSNKLHGKQETERFPLNQITQKVRSQKQTILKSRKGVIDTKKAAEKLKTSSLPREKGPLDKKDLTLKKVTAANRKPLEKEIVRAKIVSRSHSQEKVTSTISRKNKNHTHSNSNSDSAPKRAARATFNDCNCPRKDKSPLARTVAKSLTRIVEGKKDDRSTDTNENAELSIIPTTTTLGSLITMEKETDECDVKIIECCNESPNSLCDVSPLTPEFEIDASTAEVIDPNIHSETDIQIYNKGSNPKALLLSSSSFLSHAEELFDLNINGLQASCCNDIENSSSKPFIDCAIELVEHKCHQDLQVAQGHTSNSKVQISVEKLAEEVCNDIEALISHRSICGENLLVDTVYAVLERDLCSKQMINGIWDLGWKNGFYGTESEQVVNDIEKLILSGLVEESFI